MSVANSQDRLELPGSLEAQLHAYKRRVWTVKLTEAACIAAFGLLLAYLTVFVLDRVWDTPRACRGIILGTAAFVACCIPMALYRWVWQKRRLEQLARLISRRMPQLGDQLLGIIELVDSDGERARSRALCEAAIRQTAADTERYDLAKSAIPKPRHRQWGLVTALPLSLAIALLVVCSAAASNTWMRFLAPWKNLDRYTFADVEKLPKRYVVPHGEPVTANLKLQDGSRWEPTEGKLYVGKQPVITAPLQKGKYQFDIPPQLVETPVFLRIGDSTQDVQLAPMLRPELNGLTANYTLPKYLGRSGTHKKDGRGGSVALVKGSRVDLNASISRRLSTALVNGKPVTPQEANILTEEMLVAASSQLELRWEDEHGLAGKEPFVLSLNARDDEIPMVACEDLPRMKILLDSEQLAFTVRSQDDFGVKRVGFEWNGLDQSGLPTKYKGERILGAGGPDKESLELRGTFAANALGIEPQPIQVRVFAEDYFPGRPRTYSLPCTFYILNPVDHAIWVTEQLSKWHRHALEVRDREMELHQTNKQFRELTSKDLDKPETRRKLEQQSHAERANGRRLANLVGSGEDLVRQAMRNPEFGVGHLEKWAEMLKILKDISGSRMPSVADLLKAGSQAPLAANNPNNQNPGSQGESKPSDKAPTTASSGKGGGGDKKQQKTDPSAPTPKSGDELANKEQDERPESEQQKQGPTVGKSRLNAAGGKGSKTETKKGQPVVPKINNTESTMGVAKKQEETPQDGAKKPPSASFKLPVTMVQDNNPKKKKPGASPPTPAEQKVDEAIAKQQDLLAEFDKIAAELERVLANLEGSTLVKRLKSASRTQYKIGGKISEQVSGAFGVVAAQVANPATQVFGDLTKQEAKASQDVSYIMDDLQAFSERRNLVRFQTVLEEMRKEDVIGGLRQLGDDLKKETGLSIAQSEFWADTLDRWADNLVDPACSGKCCGCKCKGCLPPSIVLEVLQILEAEVNLREETRVVQQSKAAVGVEQWTKAANKQSQTQQDLQKRVEVVNGKIALLPDAAEDFGKEMQLLKMVAMVMGETVGILARPETGKPAIAAETEIIELLLRSKKFNPKGGGGGGGSSPGGGGGGTTETPALALMGSGVNEKEVREDRGTEQATGDAGPVLPEEFRAGLDEYFNRLERGKSAP